MTAFLIGRRAAVTFLITWSASASYPAPAADLPPEGSAEWCDIFIGRTNGNWAEVKCPSPACVLHDKGLLQWDAAQPEILTCRECKLTFPRAEFPEDRADRSAVPAHNGATMRYHVRGDSRYYFSECITRHKLMHALRVVAAKQVGSARKGSAEAKETLRNILLALARNIHNYKSLGGVIVPEFVDTAQEPWRGGAKLTFGFGDYSLLIPLVDYAEACRDILKPEEHQAIEDMIAHLIETNVMPYHRGSRGLGGSGQVLAAFYRAGTAFPDMKMRDLAWQRRTGQERVLTGAELAASCISSAYDYNNLLGNLFYADGVIRYLRSISYNEQIAGYMPALVDAIKEARPIASDQRLYERVMNRFRRAAYPDGTLIPIGDSHLGRRLMKTRFEPATELFGMSGLACLVDPRGGDPAGAYLVFGRPDAGHGHKDLFSLTYYAQGQEIVTDMGYAQIGEGWTRLKQYQTPLWHNTAIVDGENPTQRGQVTAFGSTAVADAVQVSAPAAYSKTTEYRRTLVMIKQDAAYRRPGYLLDVFSVKGGATHDFILHAQESPGDRGAMFSVSAESESPPPAARESIPPPNEASELAEAYRDLEIARTIKAVPGRAWTAQWEFGGSRNLTFRLLRLAEVDEQNFAVAMLGTRLSSDPRFEGERKMIGVLARRRQAEGNDAPLSSNFVSVLEEFTGDLDAIHGIRSVPVERTEDATATAVRVDYQRGHDIIIVASTPGLTRVPSHGIETDARVSVVRYGRSDFTPAMLLDGESLSWDDVTLSAGPVISGQTASYPDGLAEDVFDETDSSVDVSEKIPASAVGRPVSFSHNDGSGSVYQIKAITPLAVGTRLTLDQCAREKIGWADFISPDGAQIGSSRILVDDSSLRGCAIRVGDQWTKIVAVDKTSDDPGAPYCQTFKVDPPLKQPATLLNRNFPITRMNRGDAFRIMNVKCNVAPPLAPIRQPLPAVAATATVPGVHWTAYRFEPKGWRFPELDATRVPPGAKAFASGQLADVILPPEVIHEKNFVLVLSGQLAVPASGEFQFSATSGSPYEPRIFIDGQSTLFATYQYAHAQKYPHQGHGNVSLAAGRHELQMVCVFGEDGSSGKLTATIAGPKVNGPIGRKVMFATPQAPASPK